MSNDVLDTSERFIESVDEQPITCIRSADGVITLTIYSQKGEMSKPIELNEENAIRLMNRLATLVDKESSTHSSGAKTFPSQTSQPSQTTM